jgi:hypothetical protein
VKADGDVPVPRCPDGHLTTGTSLRVAAAVALAAVAAAFPPPARATVVDLTVESSTAPAPLFSGLVETTPHAVDGGDGSGPHPCWGPPSATPAPTATGALDDAMRIAGIPWRGNWNPSFRDFFVERIGPYASAVPDNYWSLSVNGRFSAGGCLATVTGGDVVRFYYGPLFGTPPETDPAPGGPASGRGGAGSGGPSPAKTHRAERRILARRAALFLRRSAADEIGEDWAGLALALRGRRAPSGAARRLDKRLWSLPDLGSIGPDIDSTALRAWVLAIRGRHAMARQAAAFVRSTQAADGGFPALPGGDSNAQSTGVALVALRVAGLGPRPTAGPGGPTPLDYLAFLARSNGSIAYAPGSSPTPVWTTAQVLLGLTSREKLMQMDTLRSIDDRTTNGRENQAGRGTQGGR